MYTLYNIILLNCTKLKHKFCIEDDFNLIKYYILFLKYLIIVMTVPGVAVYYSASDQDMTLIYII